MKENTKTTRLNARLDDATNETLRQVAASRHGGDMTATIAEAIQHLAALEFPPAKVGYIKLDRLGETEPVCRECDQPLGGKAFMIVFSDGSLRGPVCASCAESE